MVQAISTSVKGRARYKIEELYHSEELKEYLARKLSGEEIIDEITINTLTGSILIRYNSGSTPEAIASLLEGVLDEYRKDMQGGRAIAATSRASSNGAASAEEPAAVGKMWSPAGAKLHLKGVLHRTEGQKAEPWHTMGPGAVLDSFSSSETLGYHPVLQRNSSESTAPTPFPNPPGEHGLESSQTSSSPCR